MKMVSMKAPVLNGPEHVIVVGRRSLNLAAVVGDVPDVGRRAKDLGGVMRGMNMDLNSPDRGRKGHLKRSTPNAEVI